MVLDSMISLQCMRKLSFQRFKKFLLTTNLHINMEKCYGLTILLYLLKSLITWPKVSLIIKFALKVLLRLELMSLWLFITEEITQTTN